VKCAADGLAAAQFRQMFDRHGPLKEIVFIKDKATGLRQSTLTCTRLCSFFETRAFAAF
jgi:hypothetical protein